MNDGKASRLSSMEYAIVAYLASVKPRRATRNELLDHVGGDYGSMAVMITLMRRKLQHIGLDISYGGRNGVSLIEVEPCGQL